VPHTALVAACTAAQGSVHSSPPRLLVPSMWSAFVRHHATYYAPSLLRVANAAIAAWEKQPQQSAAPVAPRGEARSKAPQVPVVAEAVTAKGELALSPALPTPPPVMKGAPAEGVGHPLAFDRITIPLEKWFDFEQGAAAS